MKVHALRGTLTARIVSEIEGENKISNCVLADPGLLAFKLLKEKISKKYDIGIITLLFLGADVVPIDLRKEEFPEILEIHSKYQISKAMVKKKERINKMLSL